MSGHSKWHSIKHKKALTDAKKSNVFTKVAKDISVAARGGGDPETNFQLRMAVDKAKSLNLPKDNIERAIKKGTGESKDSTQIEEIVYEAYGPGQIAMLIKTVTDNKNRTLGEIKNIAQKNGGKIVEGGSVNWQFKQIGKLVTEFKEGFDDEEFEMTIIESGATDYEKDENEYHIFTQSQDLQKVKEALEKAGLNFWGAELIFVPQNKVSVDDETLKNYEKLHDALDENDDVMDIRNNLN